MMENNVVPFHADPLRKAYELIDSIYDMAPTPAQAAKLDEAIHYLQLAIEQSRFRVNADHDGF
jgi:hypothetical protein